jgi:chemotaxis protein histidine kinase CheA
MNELRKKPESEPGFNDAEAEKIQSFSKDQQRTTVRFTADEFDQIRNAAELSGESIPRLLKMSFFRGRKLRLLFDKSDAHAICSELRRIGNNVNQIARNVNNGALEGWHSEFAEVAQRLSEIFRRVVNVYGSR